MINIDAMSNTRDLSIDFSKGILIVLMVCFHLGFITNNLPNYYTDFVYCFHMPAFLVISGFFFKPSVDLGIKILKIRSLLVPYIVFELFYLLGIGLIGPYLHASNSFELSFASIIYAICFNPIGTYWYLHTLLICYIVFYCVYLIPIGSKYDKFYMTALILFGISLFIDNLNFSNVLFFLIGLMISFLNLSIQKFFVPSILSVLLLIVITCNAETLNRYSLAGLGITYFAMSALFYLYNFNITAINRLFSWIGKNSLAIVLFSPMLTIVASFFTRYFNFTCGVLLWSLIFVPFIVCSSILASWIMDRTYLSKVLVGRNLYKDFDTNYRVNTSKYGEEA